MSKHHRHTQPAPQRPGKKAAEREARIQAARQRMLFHKFVALALLCLDQWQKSADIQDDIAGLPTNERRFFTMQIAKCLKRVQDVVRILHNAETWPKSPTGAFYQDASDQEHRLLHIICFDTPSMPKACRCMDVHAVITYLIYCCINDWFAMHMDSEIAQTAEFADMYLALKAFANHVIAADSPLIVPLNEVYWSTRESLHAGAPLPDYTIKTQAA